MMYALAGNPLVAASSVAPQSVRAGDATLLGGVTGLATASITRTRMILSEPGLVRVVDVKPSVLPTCVVWPPLVPPTQTAASRLQGVTAGLADGRFFAVDRGAAVVWALTVGTQGDPRVGAQWDVVARYPTATPPLALDLVGLPIGDGYAELAVLDTIYVQGYHFRDSPTAFIDTVLNRCSLCQPTSTATLKD